MIRKNRPRVIAMIPARLGSKRVIKKNLRLINNKPFISYIIDKVRSVDIFDEIYINSESDIFEEIAKKHQLRFYKRPELFSSDTATNDEFTYDFMNKVPGDILIQILPTSPLIPTDEIKKFTETMLSCDYDSLISVEARQIASIYDNHPLNFNPLSVNPPSQHMTPVFSYATVLMGWKYDSYKTNMRDLGSAYHGGQGKTGYYELRGLSTIDVDREEDFNLVEAIIKSGFCDNNNPNPPKYYDDPFEEYIEIDVPEIMKKDGVLINNFQEENLPMINIEEIIDNYGKEHSWSRRIINTENNSATLICQMPGEGNRLHYHPDWNEWWYIIDGEWEWEIEKKKFQIKKNDIVFITKGKIHKITAIGNSAAIRLAVSRADVAHVYPK